jgi:hypothetical protein
MLKEKIYQLLYFTPIGGKMLIKCEESDLIWRNLRVYQRVLKRQKMRFKREDFQGSTLIWRVK